MNLSNVKLIVTDLDGTLLNSNHEASDLFFNLFEKIKTYGIIFVAASGRPLYGMTEKLANIKDDIIIVAENGGIAVKQDEVLLSNAMSYNNMVLINQLISSLPDAHPVFCTKNKAFTTSKNENLLQILTEFYKNHEIIDGIDKIVEPVLKIAIYHELNTEQFVYPHLKHLEENFKVKISATNWLDISEMNSNKGHVVQRIQEKHNITYNETLAFGDFNNDIEMLQRAYFSYAMENAHPKVKETANFSTKNNDNFGVESVLQQLIDAKEKALN